MLVLTSSCIYTVQIHCLKDNIDAVDPVKSEDYSECSSLSTTHVKREDFPKRKSCQNLPNTDAMQRDVKDEDIAWSASDDDEGIIFPKKDP